MSFPLHAALLFGLALALSTLGTWILIRVSARLHLHAQPRADRWHKLPTPNTGGIAIVFAAVVTYFVSGNALHSTIALPALGVSVLGVIDDRLRLRPLVKLGGQMVAVAAVIASGLVFRPTGVEALDIAITFFWIVGITNAFNLIDNMDGLCAGVAIITAGFRFLTSLQTGDISSALSFAIIAGAFGGFLVFNYRPARIFMGDGGSMFAGFTLATLAISSNVPHTRVITTALLAPALTFLYPIFDTVLVSVLRRAAGRPVSVGGRDHSSHRLASLGLGEHRVVWLLWGLTAAGSAVAFLTSWMPFGTIAVAVLLTVAVALLGVFLASLPGYGAPETAPIRSTRVRRAIPTLRAALTLFVDVALAGIALLCAFLIRWESGFLGAPLQDFVVSLPIVMVGYAVASIVFRSFNTGWRYFGMRDIPNLFTTVVSGAALAVFVLWGFGLRGYSRGVVVLYVALMVGFTSAFRITLRILRYSLATPTAPSRAAILGANPAGELAVLILQSRQGVDTQPVLVVETDPALDRSRMHGLPVRYVGANAAETLQRARVDTLIVPPNSPWTRSEQQLAESCTAMGINVLHLDFAVRPIHESPLASLSRSVAAPAALTPSTSPQPASTAV